MSAVKVFIFNQLSHQNTALKCFVYNFCTEKIISCRHTCWTKIIFDQSNLYSANMPSKARLSGVTAESVFNSEIKEPVP